LPLISNSESGFFRNASSDMVVTPNSLRHPEALAKRASKGDGPCRHPSRAAFGGHLRMTE
jgi:hypothetical protein